MCWICLLKSFRTFVIDTKMFYYEKKKFSLCIINNRHETQSWLNPSVDLTRLHSAHLPRHLTRKLISVLVTLAADTSTMRLGGWLSSACLASAEGTESLWFLTGHTSKSFNNAVIPQMGWAWGEVGHTGCQRGILLSCGLNVKMKDILSQQDTFLGQSLQHNTIIKH